MSDRRVFFVSDTHFGHRKILEMCRPQFSTLAEMEDCIVTNWRETVRQEDLVYHLGDFAVGVEHALRVRPLLTGTIRLIVGNHDDIPALAEARLFQRMQMWRIFPEYGFQASHVPLRWQNMRYGVRGNVHGHVHDSDEELEVFHLNVCVEATDYRPVPVGDLVEAVGQMPVRTADPLESSEQSWSDLRRMMEEAPVDEKTRVILSGEDHARAFFASEEDEK